MATNKQSISSESEHDFKVIKQRFLLLNEQRLKRSFSDLKQRQLDFLEILPLLYHTNQPLLPGYASKSTPAGIANYSPSTNSLQIAKKITNSFSYKRRAYRRYFIQAIYLMGSTGTIAYSNKSDFDIWLCYDNTLNDEQVSMLKKKSEAIEEWGRKQDIDVHIFLINPDEFRQGKHDSLNSESSGTALHYLLLDEFYRTSLLLAGRYPLWWLVPPEQEDEYDEFVENIKRKRFVHGRDHIDFGGLNNIPADEFYGASLWLLYKGIHSPYKSVLKILLMESYADDYPKTKLLASNFKKHVYNEVDDLNELDPYLLMLNKVEKYLKAKNDHDRLDLIRRSFYFKIDKKLSLIPTPSNWREELLTKLVNQWQWTTSQLFILDSKDNWKIQHVIKERNELINIFTYSYRFLSEFTRQHSRSSLISKKDLNVLGRKLYASFERKAGKIDIVYLGITKHLYETHLSIHRLFDEQHHEFWVIFNGIVNDDEIAFSTPLKQAYSLIELIAWCYFNKVLTTNTITAIYGYGNREIGNEINSIVKIMYKTFTDALLTSDNINALGKPAEISKVLSIINVGVDPFQQHTSKGHHITTDRTDSLRYGGRLENLALSIDQIVVTSWHEVLTYRYVGIEGIFKCIHDYMQWNPPSNHVKPIPINAVSFSSYRGDAISKRITELFSDIYEYYYSNKYQKNTYYIMAIEWDYYILKLVDDQLTYTNSGNIQSLLSNLSKPTKKFRNIVFDKQTLSDEVYPILFKNNIQGIVQVYFKIASNYVHTYILDENGSLFTHDCAFYDAISLVNQYEKFIDAVTKRMTYLSHSNNTSVQRVSFYYLEHTENNDWKILKHRSNNLFKPSKFISLQVIVENIDGNQTFKIFCNDKEYSTLSHGESIFQKVADHIIKLRSGKEKYPIYITDIDLSLINQDTAHLQTINYLQYKKYIENKLYEYL